MSNKYVTTLPSFLLCALLLSIFSHVISGCGTTLNEKNYLKCRQILEKDRQKVRAGNGFSYNSQSFEECRASARFQTDAD